MTCLFLDVLKASVPSRVLTVASKGVRLDNVAIPSERLVHLPKWMLKLYEVKRKFSMTPEKMADTYVWLAADPAGEKETGGYWDAPCVQVRANRNAYDKETQKRLWAVSRFLTGVHGYYDLD